MQGASLRTGPPSQGFVTQHISKVDTVDPNNSTESISYYTGTDGWRWTFHLLDGALAEMELYRQPTDPGEHINLLDPNPPT